MRRILAATATLAMFSMGGPDVPEAEADLCRFYCETVTVACKLSFGKVDEDYCESWREGCVDGCRVEAA